MKIAEFDTATASLYHLDLAREGHAATDKYLFAENALPAEVVDQIATKDGTIPRKWVELLEHRWGLLIAQYGVEGEKVQMEDGTEVDKDYLVSNAHWRICDGIDILTPFPKGTKFRLPYCWAFKPDGGMTEPVDIEYVTKNSLPLPWVIQELMLKYQETCGSTRYYFIEGLRHQKDGTVEIAWGT